MMRTREERQAADREAARRRRAANPEHGMLLKATPPWADLKKIQQEGQVGLMKFILSASGVSAAAAWIYNVLKH